MYPPGGINHLDQFGLQQVYLRMKGLEYTPLDFTAQNMASTGRGCPLFPTGTKRKLAGFKC